MMFNIDRSYAKPTPPEIEALARDGSRNAKFGIVKRWLQFEMQDQFQHLVHLRHEMDELQKLFDDVRPVKLSGLTGTGKTVCLAIAVERWRRALGEAQVNSAAIVVDVKARVSALGRGVDDVSYTAGDLGHHVNALIITDLLTRQGPDVAKRLFEYVCRVHPAVPRNVGIDATWPVAPRDISPDVWQAFVERVKDSGIEATTLLKVLSESGYRLCLAFDNVDRLIYRVQRRLFTVAIDYSNEVQMPVVFSCRDRNLKRDPDSGVNGDVLYPVHLSTGQGYDHSELQWLFDEVFPLSNPEPVHLTDEQFRDLVLRRTSFVLSRPYVQSYFRDEYAYQTDHNRLGDVGVIEQRATLVLNRAMAIWTGKFGVLTYFNGGIRETANMLTVALFRVLLEIDHGFEYTNLFARSYEREAQISGRITSHFMGCLCTGSEPIPRSLAIFNVFASASGTFLSSVSTVLFALRRNWNVEEFSLAELSRMWGQFGVAETEVREIVTQLAKSRLNGSHGFLMGPSLDFDLCDVPAEEQALLFLPAAAVFFGSYIYKVEYLFWALLYRDWPDAEYSVLSRVELISRPHEEPVIRLDDKVRYVMRALEFVYEREFRGEVERLDEESYTWRNCKWLGPLVFQKMVDSFQAFVTELSQEGIEGIGHRAVALSQRIASDLNARG